MLESAHYIADQTRTRAFFKVAVISILVFSGFVISGQLWNPALFILCILFSLFCLVAASDFVRGFYIYLAILPFTYFLKRLLFFFPPVTQTEWFIATALPDVLLIFIFLNLIFKKTNDYQLLSRFNAPILIFFLWCIIEIFNPASLFIIGITGFKKTGFYILMYYISYAVYIGDRNSLHKVARITVYCSIVVAIYAIIQSIFGFFEFEMDFIRSGLAKMNMDSIGVFYSQDIIRPFSTFSGPWIMGDYIVIGLSFYILLFINRMINHGRVLFFLTVACLTYGLLVSLSRSSYLMLILSLSFIFIFYAKDFRSFLRRTLSSTLLIGSIVYIISIIWEIVPGGLLTAIFSMHNYFGRVEQWETLPLDYAISPMGIGIGSIQSSSYFGLTRMEEVHSFLYSLIYEVGLVGLGLFIWIFIAVTKNIISWRSHITLHRDNSLVVALSAIFFSMIISKSMAGGLWGMNMHDNYLWLSCGLLLSFIHHNETYVNHS
jgi:hypothetical protein